MPNHNKFDENPQWMNFTVTESAANTFTQQTVPTPVIHSMGNDQAWVMEILKIFFYQDEPELINVTNTAQRTQLTSASKAAIVGLDDPDLIMMAAAVQEVTDTAVTDTTIATNFPIQPYCFDLTDGAGNGILCASKNLYLGTQGTNQGGAKTARAKMLYRMKKVSATELLGILQV